MKRQSGEITVFLSLVLVCILSLLMGLLESARTVGARLYLQMAADSAMASVMSQYNRNLWDMYQLLFLEYDSEKAIENSFNEYFDFYMEQENLYPMKRKSAAITSLVNMRDENAGALEDEIVSYVKYRFPEMAMDLAGITKEAEEAGKAGDFRSLLKVCRQAGKRTRELEKKREAIEDSLEEMRKLAKHAKNAVDNGNAGTFLKEAGKLENKMEAFSELVDAYEAELKKLSQYRESLEAEESPEDEKASGAMNQEVVAYQQAEEAAGKMLDGFREMEGMVESGLENLEMAMAIVEEYEENDDDDEDEEPDWDEVQMYMESVEIPETEEQAAVDKEKAAALDRVQEFLEKDLLDYLVPEGTEISGKKVSLSGIPSSGRTESARETADPVQKMLVNEYILLYFSSFTETGEGAAGLENCVLSYEQEYLLSGKAEDRENLKNAVDSVLAIRGAMNLLYLLSATEKKAQADSLAAAVSSGVAPAQMVISFLILSLWAFGEAVVDCRSLLAGTSIPFWKSDGTWKLSLENLLALDFSAAGTGEETSGLDYEAYLRVLFFLEDPSVRNFRMMDVIQWNVRKKQADFAVGDCAYRVELEAEVQQHHVFLIKDEYTGRVSAAGAY